MRHRHGGRFGRVSLFTGYREYVARTPAFFPWLPKRAPAELMARIHAVLPDGSLVEGVEVFRRAYTAVGLGWTLAWTAWPGLRPLADAGYRWFARNRLRLTGRGAHACAGGRCLPAPSPTRAPPAPRG